MGSNLAIRDSLFVRVLRALKLVDVSPEGEINHSAGADFIPNAPSTPAYDPLSSLSSMASFPFVYAAVSALASDASSLKIRVVRGEGKDAEPADDHALSRLLNNPSSRIPSVLFWRQCVTDLVLTGDCFILIAGSTEPEALLRLHPSRVRIFPQSDGQPGSYEYHGGGKPQTYTYEQVLHIRTPSWADDPRSLWGVGAIQSLHNDLMTDRRTQKLTAASAQTGRPTGIISPSEEGDRWSSEMIKTIRSATERQMSSGSGLLVMGGACDYTPVGWSPKDMEFSSVREFTVSAILACLDVPPTRVGLPSANYATSREQAVRYWEGIRGKMELVSSELNRLAKLFPDGDDLSVHFDFSGVQALQESRNDRVNRVMTWVSMGVPIADAASYEGFDDLPTDNIIDPFDALMGDTAPAPAPAPYEDDAPLDEDEPDQPVDADDPVVAEVEPDQPVAAQALNGAQIASLLEVLAAVASGALTNDAGVQLILVAFPMIPIDAAQALVDGAVNVSEDTEQNALRTLRQYGLRLNRTPDGAQWLSRTTPEQIEQSYDLIDVCRDVTDAAARSEYARAFVDNFHHPYERAFNKLVRRYFRGQAARTAKRLEDVLPAQKSIKRATLSDTWIREILAESVERATLDSQLRPLIEKMVRRAIAQALKNADQTGEIVTPEWIQNKVATIMADLTENVYRFTETEVVKVIEDGIDDGKTIAEMQSDLMQNHAFSAERALRVSRTETTKAVASGTRQTYEELSQRGIEMEIFWIASPNARPAHRELDDQNVSVGPGEMFVVPAGAGVPSEHVGKKSAHPGGFGHASLDINCRCTIVSRVKK